MKIAILGFGKEGQSAYRYYDKAGHDITIHDNDSKIHLPSGTQAVLGDTALNDLDSYGYDLIARSPGLRIDKTQIKTPITTPTAEFMKVCPAEIIGVTGTKGKGTTATLIEQMLTESGQRTHLLGNIGTPALDELPNIKPSDLVVYEMSSFQLYDIQSSPHVAVCLFVTEDHLDWHSDLAEYHAAKGNIFKYQTSSDVAVYYTQNPTSKTLAKLSPATTHYSYGDNGDVVVRDGKINAFGSNIIDIKAVKLPGEHNLQNICAAICAVWPYTQDISAIKKVIETFAGLPYHIEHVLDKAGVSYYNDSFSTNPVSAIAAVESFEQPIVLFLGGFDKQANFTELADVLKTRKIRKIITYDKTGSDIQKLLTSKGIADVEYISGDDFKAIIAAGVNFAQPGDVVLFSPACASWGMFSDYKSRGQIFNDIITSIWLLLMFTEPKYN